MKSLARRAAHVFSRLVPYRLLRLLVRAWALGVTQGDPRSGLEKLVRLYDDLYLRLDHLAIAYDDGLHVKHRLTRYHDFFVERIVPGERVLDVGCGRGAVAHSIAERAGAVVVGIDTDAAHIEFARRRFPHPRLTFVTGDALQELPEGTYDVVVLSNVLEHIDDRVRFLRRLREQAGARRFLVRVPLLERDWLVPLRAELGFDHMSDPTHFVEYDAAGFEAELAQAGLRPSHLEQRWGEIWAEAVPA